MQEDTDYDSVLELLTKISEAILDYEHPHSRLETIIRKATEAVHSDAGSIAIPTDNNRELSFTAHYDSTDRLDNALGERDVVPTGEGITGRAFSDREMFEFSNDQSNSGIEAENEPLPSNFETIVSIPLIVQSECIGVVNLYFQDSVDLEDSQEEILRAVAKQSGIAIRQARRIQELEQLTRRLRIEAATDELTNLPNQGKIMKILKGELERSKRYNRPLTLMMLDVDHFKQINDQYGHPAGDEALKKLAEWFRDEIRHSDSVGRYGGEEFMFVLPETLEHDAYSLSERIRERCHESTIPWEDTDINLTVSCGLAEWNPELELDDEELLNRADRALLVSKREGRDQTICYTALGTS
ncbi:MAG: diguanylate cyclase [bacterium]